MIYGYAHLSLEVMSLLHAQDLWAQGSHAVGLRGGPDSRDQVLLARYFVRDDLALGAPWLGSGLLLRCLLGHFLHLGCNLFLCAERVGGCLARCSRP